jgi:hypothetical protein
MRGTRKAIGARCESSVWLLLRPFSGRGQAIRPTDGGTEPSNLGDVSAPTGGFAPLPRDPDEPVSRFTADQAEKIVGPVLVVGLGAICDLRRASPRSQSFKISEFALLDDGRRVILHSERGYSIGWGSNVEIPAELAPFDTRESITQQVLNTVLPDDDDSQDAHPWEWLAELARARGLDVTSEDLRVLPYEVVLDESVTRWLDSGEARPR